MAEIPDEHQWTLEQQIADLQVKKPHVVILGAGASVAALPNGDKNGRRLPTMNNFIKVLGLTPILKKHGISNRRNFEVLYSSLCADPKFDEARSEIESVIRTYFSGMELPDHPTLYDHLVLCLRSKDVIATFNWDPFLWQACTRNHQIAKMPQTLFLHGCVAVGTDMENLTQGPANFVSRTSGRRFTPTPILFPISKKDYNSDEAIKMSWSAIQEHLKSAFALTIFGYGAPKSDVEAIFLMKNAWGDVEERQFEETEIIDLKNEETLQRAWSRFIHTHHYRVSNDFYASVLGAHPRRSCEAFWNRFFMCKWLTLNPLPKEVGFPELYEWLRPLLEAESGKV